MGDDCSVFFGQKTPDKSLSSMSDTDRDKMASSDFEFLDALPRITSLESLNLSSALEVSKFHLSYR